MRQRWGGEAGRGENRYDPPCYVEVPRKGDGNDRTMETLSVQALHGSKNIICNILAAG